MKMGVFIAVVSLKEEPTAKLGTVLVLIPLLLGYNHLLQFTRVRKLARVVLGVYAVLFFLIVLGCRYAEIDDVPARSKVKTTTPKATVATSSSSSDVHRNAGHSGRRLLLASSSTARDTTGDVCALNAYAYDDSVGYRTDAFAFSCGFDDYVAGGGGGAGVAGTYDMSAPSAAMRHLLDNNHAGGVDAPTSTPMGTTPSSTTMTTTTTSMTTPTTASVHKVVPKAALKQFGWLGWLTYWTV
jgi:hypothetical protein